MDSRLDRAFMAAIFVVAFLGTGSGAMAQTKPVPLINQPLVPDAVAPGGPAFILTVNGTGFVNKSVVEWTGSKRTTTVVSHSQLTATISARDIATAGTASVTVVNPAPTGGRSNVVFLSITNSTTHVGFNMTSTSPQSEGSNSAAVGDFNGDGKPDLAVANGGDPGTVSIFLGDGTGNFTLASSSATGNNPLSIVVGDFNGDGKLDIATANDIGSEGGSVSVLLGDGTGNFTLASTLTTGGTFSLAVGDFNGDGNLDIAVPNYAVNGTVSVFLGDGTGKFTLASSPSTGSGPLSVAVGDFNGDDKLDLAVVNQNSATVSVLLGDGTGHFTLVSSPATGAEPLSVAVGDFNGDGNLDLAVANQTDGTVSILLGDGTGNFTLASSPHAGRNPFSVAVGDFNGDGKLDLAVANYASIISTASILLGDGTGNFTLASYPNTSSGGSFSVALGDFNGDGKMDFAAATGSSVAILLQAPAVTISPGSLNFGDAVIGTISASQSATVKNVGYATVNISGITLTGNDPTEFSETNNCPSSLPVGASCAITTTFSPVYSGSGTSAVAVSDDGGNNPTALSLTGTGLSLELSATSLNFGDVMVGQSSQPQTVMLTNVTTEKVNIRGISVTGDMGDFPETNTCGTHLDGGKSCNIVVTFTPTLTGLRSATIKISDNGGGGPLKIALSGTGT